MAPVSERASRITGQLFVGLVVCATPLWLLLSPLIAAYAVYYVVFRATPPALTYKGTASNTALVNSCPTVRRCNGARAAFRMSHD